MADFGLSRLNLPVGYQAQTVCGTPYYMSPERIIEEPYTFASDIWSLGCILYEVFLKLINSKILKSMGPLFSSPIFPLYFYKMVRLFP